MRGVRGMWATGTVAAVLLTGCGADDDPDPVAVEQVQDDAEETEPDEGEEEPASALTDDEDDAEEIDGSRCVDDSGGYRWDHTDAEDGSFETEMVPAELSLDLLEVELALTGDELSITYHHDVEVPDPPEDLGWRLQGVFAEEIGGAFGLSAGLLTDETLMIQLQPPASPDEEFDPFATVDVGSGELEVDGTRAVLTVAWSELEEHGVELPFSWAAELMEVERFEDGDTVGSRGLTDSCPDIDPETRAPAGERPEFTG
jgi:hypothetical protein